MADKKNNTLEKIQLEMKDTLEGLGFIDVVSASSRNGDVRFLCRVHDEKKWLKVLSEFLSNEGSWYSFIGKKYFVSKSGSLVFGWVLIFESEDLDKAVQEIRRTLLAAYTIVSEADSSQTEEEKTTRIPGGKIDLDYSERFGSRVRAVR